MSKKPLKILQLIPKIMNEIGAIAKQGRNEDDGYAFRRIEDVYNKLQPLLVKHGVFFAPTVLESREERLNKKSVRVKQRIQYRFYAEDGSEFDSIVEGEAIDESDKATNKAMQAALKFMLTQVFCIAVAEVKDADAGSPKLNFATGAPADSKGPKIGDGKYKGKRVSDVPVAELKTYIQQMEDAANSAGKKHPKWFLELKQAVSA